MNDYAASLREWLGHVADADRGRRRFGARHHDYRLASPLLPEQLVAIEEELELTLPAPYREFVAHVGDGGAGPYHGLMPLDHPVQIAAAHGEFPLTARAGGDGPAALAGRALYRGVIGLGHAGCTYVVFLVVRGAAAGQVWLDARSAGDGVFPIHPDFRAYYHDWIARTSYNHLPEAWITPGRCALPSALSSYLAAYEQRAGVAAGTLAGEPLRAALASIGPGAIACTTSGDDPFFDPGDAIDVCARCEQMVENLAASGLERDRVAPGTNPLPMRGRWP